MELTPKVNQNVDYKAKVLSFLTVAFISACTTLQPSSDKLTKEEEILEHQIGIIINHLNLGEHEKAHFETRPLLQQHPSKAELHNLMGLAYMGLNNAKLAETYFRKAFDLRPDPAFGLNLTSALIEKKQFSEAIKLLRGFKKEGLGEYKYPERFDHNLGLAYERLGKSLIAQKYYRLALAKNPSSFQTLMQLGRLLQREKKYVHAEPIFKKAADICLRCYEPVKRRSDTLISLGRSAEARRALLDYIETDQLRPQDAKLARQYISRLDPSFMRNTRKK